jgi:hypothetical protein
MLEDAAVYLTVAPVVATLALVAIGLWLAGLHGAPARVRARAPRQRR